METKLFTHQTSPQNLVSIIVFFVLVSASPRFAESPERKVYWPGVCVCVCVCCMSRVKSKPYLLMVPGGNRGSLRTTGQHDWLTRSIVHLFVFCSGIVSCLVKAVFKNTAVVLLALSVLDTHL